MDDRESEERFLPKPRCIKTLLTLCLAVIRCDAVSLGNCNGWLRRDTRRLRIPGNNKVRSERRRQSNTYTQFLTQHQSERSREKKGAECKPEQKPLRMYTYKVPLAQLFGRSGIRSSIPTNITLGYPAGMMGSFSVLLSHQLFGSENES